MKRKLLTFLLVLCFIVPSSFILFGCGDDSAKINEETWKSELDLNHTNYTITTTQTMGQNSNTTKFLLDGSKMELITEYGSTKYDIIYVSINDTQIDSYLRYSTDGHYSKTTHKKIDTVWSPTSMTRPVDDYNKMVKDNKNNMVQGVNTLLKDKFANFEYKDGVYEANNLTLTIKEESVVGNYKLKFKDNKVVEVNVNVPAKTENDIAVTIKIEKFGSTSISTPTTFALGENAFKKAIKLENQENYTMTIEQEITEQGTFAHKVTREGNKVYVKVAESPTQFHDIYFEKVSDTKYCAYMQGESGFQKMTMTKVDNVWTPDDPQSAVGFPNYDFDQMVNFYVGMIMGDAFNKIADNFVSFAFADGKYTAESMSYNFTMFESQEVSVIGAFNLTFDGDKLTELKAEDLALSVQSQTIGTMSITFNKVDSTTVTIPTVE